MGQFEGFATGWFAVGQGSDFPVGEVRRLRYFGRSLVAFRGQSGVVAVLDAICPHLGADIGVGGTVEGDEVRCPFHAWRFDGKGECIAIPYATKIPRQARVRAWEVRERNGLVFVWHDAQGQGPTWEIPVIDEYGTTEWTPWNLDCITVRTQPREIVENVADRAHFPVVHGTQVEKFENEYVGHTATQRTAGVAYPRGGGEDRFSLSATYYGPAYQVTEMEGVLKNKLVLAHTPIDEHSLDLRFGVSLKVFGDGSKTAKFAMAYVDNLRTGFHEDVQIWENKLFRDRPVLAENDGPIGRLRTWYRQFYGAGA